MFLVFYLLTHSLYVDGLHSGHSNMPIWFWWVSLHSMVVSKSGAASSTISNEVFSIPHSYLLKDSPLLVAVNSVLSSGTQKWRMSTTEYSGFTVTNTLPPQVPLLHLQFRVICPELRSGLVYFIDEVGEMLPPGKSKGDSFLVR